jgi:hypothetical protein
MLTFLPKMSDSDLKIPLFQRGDLWGVTWRRFPKTDPLNSGFKKKTLKNEPKAGIFFRVVFLRLENKNEQTTI